MKQTLTTVLIFICLFTNAQTDFDKYKSLVKEEMIKWFTKGEFEKQSEYLKRMKNANKQFKRVKKILLFKMIDYSYDPDKDILNGEPYRIDFKEYDAEREILTFDNGIIFNCNAQAAKEIKDNVRSVYSFPIVLIFNKNEIKPLKFIISNERYGSYGDYIYNYNYNDYYFYYYNVNRYKNKNSYNDIFSDKSNNFFIYTVPDADKYNSDPELTLADLNIPLSEEVKAIVFNQPKTIIPAVLTASNIGFTGSNNTNTLVANKKSNIHFTLTNTGKGVANKLTVKITDINNTVGLSYNKEIVLGSLEPNTNKDYSIDVLANLQTPNAQAKFKIEFSEENGFYPDPIEIAFNTIAFIAPKLQIMDYSFLSNTEKLEKAKPIVLKALLQNIGQGVANNIEVTFTYPNANVYNTSTNTFKFTTLEPNETKELLFEFVTNKNYTANNIPITIHVQESFKQFAEDKNVVATLAESVGTMVAVVANNQNNATTTITPASLFSDVDKNIPTIAIKNPHKYALIIGNEDYSSRQANVQKESNVPFAINDAKTFKDYCINTLGVEEENVFLLFNATAGEMASKIELVTEIVKRLGNKAELIVYYAGHGYPDEKTKAPYLIPVDVPISNLNTAIKLNDVYQKLSKTNAQKITIFLDACFTGGGREEGLITGARGVKIVPNEDALTGNLVVFSATTNDQSALPYKEKQHGIFTYYLLKALQINNGKIQLSELEKYVKEQVSIQSLKVNNKAQDPTIKLSETVKQQYLNWTF